MYFLRVLLINICLVPSVSTYLNDPQDLKLGNSLNLLNKNKLN